MDREEFLKLQHEAEARMREMQRKSREVSGIPSPDFLEVKPQKQVPQRKNYGSFLNLLNFKNIKLDSDRALIIAVLLLLSGENCDELLLLALVYIML